MTSGLPLHNSIRGQPTTTVIACALLAQEVAKARTREGGSDSSTVSKPYQNLTLDYTWRCRKAKSRFPKLLKGQGEG